jgi:hypothetical protein
MVYVFTSIHGSTGYNRTTINTCFLITEAQGGDFPCKDSHKFDKGSLSKIKRQNQLFSEEQ